MQENAEVEHLLQQSREVVAVEEEAQLWSAEQLLEVLLEVQLGAELSGEEGFVPSVERLLGDPL